MLVEGNLSEQLGMWLSGLVGVVRGKFLTNSVALGSLVLFEVSYVRTAVEVWPTLLA